MTQFNQTSKVLRKTLGRFLTALVMTTALFNRQVQAGPGHGAIVTHISPDLTGYYEAFSPDGLLKLDVATSGRGDFIRQNSDGTWTLQSVEPRAVVTLSVPAGGDDWAPMWVGVGSFHVTGSVVPGDGFYDFTNETASLHVEAKLTSLLDGSEWSLLVVAVLKDFEFKELKVDLQPR